MQMGKNRQVFTFFCLLQLKVFFNPFQSLYHFKLL